MDRYHVTGVKKAFTSYVAAATEARHISQRRPAAQIGICRIEKGKRKYVRVYLNGVMLSRGHWFAGYK